MINIENIWITRHAKKRLKERIGLRGKSAKRCAVRAATVGLTQLEIGHDLSLALSNVTQREGNHSDIRITPAGIFVFRNDCLVTVLPITDQRIRKLIFQEWNRKYQEEGNP